jgi:hypothetical protein
MSNLHHVFKTSCRLMAWVSNRRLSVSMQSRLEELLVAASHWLCIWVSVSFPPGLSYASILKLFLNRHISWSETETSVVNSLDFANAQVLFCKSNFTRLHSRMRLCQLQSAWWYHIRWGLGVKGEKSGTHCFDATRNSWVKDHWLICFKSFCV